MSKGDRYVRLVEWSEEDGGCHGTDARKVFAELCEIIEETVQLCAPP